MRIKKIRLSNGYKRFHDLTIDLGENPSKIVAMVGPNGCGKSSVFDGMLFKSNAWSKIGGEQQRDNQYHSMSANPGFNHTSVLIDFNAGTFEEVREVKMQTGRDCTIFSIRSPYRYNSNFKVTETRAVSSLRRNDYGATGASDLDVKMEQNYRRLQIKYEKIMNEADCPPSVARAKTIGDLNRAIKACIDLEIDSIGSISDSRGTLWFKKPGHPSPFEFNVLSSGEKEVVDLLLDFYLRQEDYADSIFLLDEPELHVNTAIQRQLLVEINRLVGANCQLWIATHSVGFLRALQENLKEDCQIIRFDDVSTLASQPRTLTPMKKSIHNWKRVFEIALEDLSGLVSPKRIIYCEGRDAPGPGGRERGIDAKIFNNIFSEKYHDTLFISSGGNTELDQRSQIAIAVLSKVLPDVEVLVLKDRDMASGRATTEKDRQLYLETNPPTHRVLRRWEFENYVFDKSVLAKYCAVNGLNFDEVSYDAFVSDVDNQNIKDEIARIRNFCGIVGSVSADQFKMALSSMITPDMPVFVDLERSIFERK